MTCGSCGTVFSVKCQDADLIDGPPDDRHGISACPRCGEYKDFYIEHDHMVSMVKKRIKHKLNINEIILVIMAIAVIVLLIFGISAGISDVLNSL